ncbi:hypothetical protein OSJ77_07385 [Phyllobacterium sp. 0TCS1.6C]|uniref:hypothetical protein n=1 Tax=unclassified Phyllobacterium TaxID=2638441 RepID=UPI0022640DF8|nr:MULTISPECIES: hypothetical protein [unclassified Phyllobacterium]MCX8280006.1 hypothetical protein [Phyllobacterium sp. 0TCS1.6C]MCX8296173.1 hypothetical protein [Phyllobacterium sp. 0TCS1.6A]
MSGNKKPVADELTAENLDQAFKELRESLLNEPISEPTRQLWEQLEEKLIRHVEQLKMKVGQTRA